MVVQPNGGAVEGGVGGMEQSSAIAVALPPGLRVHGYPLLGPVQGTVAISHLTCVSIADARGAALVIIRIRMTIGRVIALTDLTDSTSSVGAETYIQTTDRSIA